MVPKEREAARASRSLSGKYQPAVRYGAEVIPVTVSALV
jgi:hypothetical protein